MTKENEALTPRHEAPAEGAGEDDKLLHDSYIAMCDAMKLIDADEGPGRVHSNALQALAGCRHRIEVRTSAQYALRARSSAPEAREEALGNLLAVIHGDGGHRALEVGTKQAALEAEKIVANLLSSAPQAREDAQPVRWLIEDLILPQETVTDNEAYAQRRAEYRYEGEATARVRPLYTHPSAPSADKLRIAVEALEKTRKLVSDASSTGFTDQDSVRALFVNNGALTRALAVLESGAK